MPVLNYAPGDLVDVRSGSPTWYPGVVSFVDDSKIVVDLDPPFPTGNQWSGLRLPIGGTSPVSKVTVWTASEILQSSENAHIRSR